METRRPEGVKAPVGWARMGRWALIVAGLLYTLGVLAIDATATRTQQHLLGAGTVVVLLLCSRLATAAERREMWFCLVYGTAIELLATQLWGLYHYRFGNVP